MAPSNFRTRLDRRSFLARTAATAGISVAAPFTALLSARPSFSRPGRGPSPDYGPLFPAIDETTGLPLLMLPEDFRYLSFGWTRDPMNDGRLTPSAHDGMATFAAGRGRIYLVRNHEIADGPDAFAPDLAYDPEAGGGTTTLEFDTNRGLLLSSWSSISGTVRNCAGGTTPWGSWLTCEETTLGIGDGDLTKNHGYIFEVPASGPTLTAGPHPTPFNAMGRFSHEALAIDPATGWVYETEDGGSSSGFYRFKPTTPGVLEDGGVLEMLGIAGVNLADTRTNQNHQWRDVVWHVIDTPDPAVATGATSVYNQGRAKGAARFGKLEGAWYGLGSIFFVASSGGNVGQGQIFEYDPANQRLRLVFESPSADVLNAPDNITVSPRGGLVLCEDGDGTEYVHGLTTDGVIFRFIQNNVDLRTIPWNGFNSDFRASEFAGACYSPDGKWLFVNIQSPGISFAITGPWGSGGI
ncbi:MAG TPA: alkaline phosphatase PhoX [Vicinamibacterales bacterium]|nr:alkaline phosphatase PhoX [Vicinamibacterales bacterium]